MKVKALKCLKCNTIIYSKSNHDFKWCECKTIFIDGGIFIDGSLDYVRFGGDIKFIESVEINVDITK